MVTSSPSRRTEAASKAGIDSVDTGMRVLLALGRLGKGGHSLGAIAAAAVLTPAKVHRYLVSFVRTGFVEQDSYRGRYRLGPSALELGARAMGSTDALRLATEAMPQLREESGLTTALIVWGTRGPLIVWAEESEHIAAVSFKVGRDIPAIKSASGLCLSAHLPWSVVHETIEREIASEATGDGTSRVESHRILLTEIRARGLSRIEGAVSAGIATLAAPILDYTGYAAAALILSGSIGSFDADYEGVPARQLMAACRRISAMLGYVDGGEKFAMRPGS